MYVLPTFKIELVIRFKTCAELMYALAAVITRGPKKDRGVVDVITGLPDRSNGNALTLMSVKLFVAAPKKDTVPVMLPATFAPDVPTLVVVSC